jgi:hypothetical protein
MRVYSDNPTPLSKMDIPSHIFPPNRRGVQQVDIQVCNNNREFLSMLCGYGDIAISGLTGRSSIPHPLIGPFANAMAEDTQELVSDVRNGKRKFSSLIYHARGLLSSIADDSMKVELIDARRRAMAEAVNTIGEGHRSTMAKIMNAIKVVLGKDVVEEAMKQLRSNAPNASPIEGAFLGNSVLVLTQAEQILSRYDPAKDSPREGIFISAGPIKAWVQIFHSDRSAYRKSIVTPELVKDWRIIGYMNINVGSAANAFTMSPAIVVGERIKSRLDTAKTTFMEVPIGNNMWAMKRIKQATNEEEARAMYSTLSADFGDLVKFASEEMGKIPPDNINLDQAVSSDEIANYMARLTAEQLDEMAAVAEKSGKK